jgi:ankyrin repeat protein
MRLLETESLELVEVRDDAIPPYAILSHTWGDAELTLQELRWLKGRWSTPSDEAAEALAKKKGFLKVKDAAALAIRNGFSYIWIDTCCIDKTSSAELSEAINSMYRWYQMSAECYAYLSDVKSAAEEDIAAQESSLRKSRWFTRGWTLQELIAPSEVYFFANDWSYLGSKKDGNRFMEIITEMTGIDEGVLYLQIDPYTLSVATRMSWAAQRQTTRVEDMAYCLMGLFQVNMPLLYGEGKRAFTRLQQEILSLSDDQSLYAWNAYQHIENDPDQLYGLLAESPSQFRDAGGIQPLPPSSIYESAPSDMTNHGLRVQLYLRLLDDADQAPMEEDYYAILDCFVRIGEREYCPVIILRRLSNDQYARLEPNARKLLPPLQHRSNSQLEGYRTIYIRQNPVYFNLPEFRVSLPNSSSAMMVPRELDVYRLEDIHPTNRWNQTTMSLRAMYTRKMEAVGIFRFRNTSSKQETVDIAVGLRRLDHLQWEGWCYQRRAKDENLAESLVAVNKKISSIRTPGWKTPVTPFSPWGFEPGIGEDFSLISNARVETAQLQGRSYISISIFAKAEIHTSKELDPVHATMITMKAGLQEYGHTDVAENPAAIITLLRPVMKEASLWKQLDIDEDGVSNEVTGSRTFIAKMFEEVVSLHTPIAHFLKESSFIRIQDASLEALALACAEGNLDQISSLIRVGVLLEDAVEKLDGSRPIHWAVACRDLPVLKLIMEKGVNPICETKHGWNLLHIAALFDHVEGINYLASTQQIKAHGSTMVNGRTSALDTPLHIAAAFCKGSSCFLAICSLLSGSDSCSFLLARNEQDQTPLHLAAAANNVDTIRYIISQLDTHNWMLNKVWARRFMDLNYIRNVDPLDKAGRSPIWYAAAAGACEAIEALMSLGANINLADDTGLTPLHAAVREGQKNSIGMLLRYGASLAIETPILGLTPVHLAAIVDNSILDLFQYTGLLFSYVDAGSRSKALHVAASIGDIDSVRKLCEAGADVYTATDHYLSLKNDDLAVIKIAPSTAKQLAMLEGLSEIADYLQSVEGGRRPWEVMGDTMPESLDQRRHASSPYDPYLQEGQNHSQPGLTPSYSSPYEPGPHRYSQNQSTPPVLQGQPPSTYPDRRESYIQPQQQYPAMNGPSYYTSPYNNGSPSSPPPVAGKVGPAPPGRPYSTAPPIKQTYPPTALPHAPLQPSRLRFQETGEVTNPYPHTTNTYSQPATSNMPQSQSYGQSPHYSSPYDTSTGNQSTSSPYYPVNPSQANPPSQLPPPIRQTYQPARYSSENSSSSPSNMPPLSRPQTYSWAANETKTMPSTSRPTTYQYVAPYPSTSNTPYNSIESQSGYYPRNPLPVSVQPPYSAPYPPYPPYQPDMSQNRYYPPHPPPILPSVVPLVPAKASEATVRGNLISLLGELQFSMGELLYESEIGYSQQPSSGTGSSNMVFELDATPKLQKPS